MDRERANEESEGQEEKVKDFEPVDPVGEVVDEVEADEVMKEDIEVEVEKKETLMDKAKKLVGVGKKKKVARELVYLVPLHLESAMKKWKHAGVKNKHIKLVKKEDHFELTLLNKGLVNVRQISRVLKSKGVRLK